MERLTCATRSGETLDLADRAVGADALNPRVGSAFPPESRIPAVALRRTLLQPGLETDPRGLRIHGALIYGALDLEHARVTCPIHLIRCRLDDEEPANLNSAHLAELDLTGTHARSLLLRSARVDGEVRLQDAVLTNRLGTALNLDGATIGAGADLRGLTATGEVRAHGVQITGWLDLRKAVLKNRGGDALNLDGATIGGGADLRSLAATGEVGAQGARIDRWLGLVHAVLTNEGGCALNLSGATISGGAYLDGLKAAGEVLALGSRFTGQLVMANADLANEGGCALNLDWATASGGADLRGLKAAGEVHALGSQFTGQLVMLNADLANEGGCALNLDGATVSGPADLRGLKAAGEVRALRARLGDPLVLQNAVLKNEGGCALNLDGATIPGSAFMRWLTAEGGISAVDAQFGQLDLEDAGLTNEVGGDALNLDGAVVSGGAALSRLKATGRVRARGARFVGQLVLKDALLTVKEDALLTSGVEDAAALNLDGAHVDRLCLSGPQTRIRGNLMLRGTEIGDLYLDDDANELPGRLVAHGWRLRDVHGVLRTDKRSAANWLNSRPKGLRFTAQPWHELAAVYERNGQLGDGRWLRMRAAHRTTQAAPRRSRPVGWAYGALVGYGYYPLLAAAALLLTFAATAGLTFSNVSSFVPTNPTAAAAAVAANGRGIDGDTQAEEPDQKTTVSGLTDCALLEPDYPCLKPGLFALATAVPPAAAIQQNAWAPADPDKPWLDWALTGLKTFGWLSTVLLLAGVTGLLRKT